MSQLEVESLKHAGTQGFTPCFLLDAFCEVTLKNSLFFFFPVLCHVYVTMDSYLSMRVHSEVVVQELLQAVAERMGVSQGELLLVAITCTGGKNHD